MPPSPAERVKNAAHMEIMVISYRCYEILRAYPEDADEVTQRRFSHGLGREMWLAMSSIGLVIGSEVSESTTKHLPALGIVGGLLKEVTWHGLSLAIDIAKLDRERLCNLHSAIAAKQYNVEEGNVGLAGGQWWRSVSLPSDQFHAPSWWKDPSYVVPRPMPIWPRDNIDAGADVTLIQVVATDLHRAAQLRREKEEDLRSHTTRALSGQLEEDEEIAMDHERGLDGELSSP